MLAISPKDTFTVIYVTDYTAREGLAHVAATVPNVDGLKDRIVKIALFDKQVEAITSIQPRDFITIRNLRLKQVAGVGQLSGRLGGDHRLITKLHPSSRSEELSALIKYVMTSIIMAYVSHRILSCSRKQEWETSQPKGKRGSSKFLKKQQPTEKRQLAEGPSSNVQSNKTDVARSEYMWTLKEIQADSECPARYRVKAQIVSFYPVDLQEAVTRLCSKCSKE